MPVKAVARLIRASCLSGNSVKVAISPLVHASMGCSNDSGAARAVDDTMNETAARSETSAGPPPTTTRSRERAFSAML